MVVASIKFLLLSCFAVFIIGCGGNSNSAVEFSPRILNGDPIKEGALVQVARVVSISKDQHQSLCSGSVIGERSILTASHCLEDFAHLVINVAGEFYAADKVFRQSGYLVDYKLNAIFADVAIIETDRTIPIEPLAVLGSRDAIVGETISIVGYGLDQNDTLGVLRHGDMTVDILTDGHIFSHYNGSGSNACFGDSGGPALLGSSNGTAGSIAGVVSSGTRADCGPGDTTLFAYLQNPDTLQFLIQNVPDLVIN